MMEGPQNGNHHHPPPIITIDKLPRKIYLRAYHWTDANALVRVINNKNVSANLRDRLPQPYTLDDAYEWFKRCGEPTKLRHSTTLKVAVPTTYAITQGTAEGDDDFVIGAIGLEFKSDVHRRTAELGCRLGEEYWGKGVMTEVVQAFVPWVWMAFGPDLVRLCAEPFAWNEPSARILRKAGFEYEGRQKYDRHRDTLPASVLFHMFDPGQQEQASPWSWDWVRHRQRNRSFKVATRACKLTAYW